MENIIEKTFAKLSQLECSNQFLAYKKQILPKLKDFEKETEQANSLIQIAKDINKDSCRLRANYNQVLEKSYKVQMAMLEIIEKEDEKQHLTIVNNQCSSVALSNRKMANPSPRMFVADYAKSPYIKKIKPVSLKFLDFEKTIDLSQFNNIPSYMKGRETIDDLQSFLDTVIIACLTDKYTLFFKKREAIRINPDVERWKLYHNQSSYHPDKYFITQGDICTFTKTMIDTKSNRRLQMLKYLNIIKEGRVKHVVSYIWINRN